MLAGRVVARDLAVAYIASQNQVIDYSDDFPTCGRVILPVFSHTCKIYALSISYESSRQQLIVDVQRRRPQVLRVDHGDDAAKQ